MKICVDWGLNASLFAHSSVVISLYNSRMKKREKKKTGTRSQNIQSRTRTSHTRPKANRPVAERAQDDFILSRMIESPSPREPSDSEDRDSQYAHGDTEFGLVEAFVAAGEEARREIADRTCGDS